MKINVNWKTTDLDVGIEEYEPAKEWPERQREN